MRIGVSAGVLGVLLAALVGPVSAQQDPLVLKMSGFVEFGASHHALSSGLRNWNGQFARGVVVSGDNVWHGDLWRWSQFGEQGTSVTMANTHLWNADWHSHIALGTSSGGFFLPRLRLDAFLSRKLLSDRSLVLTAGVGMVDAKDVHRDKSVFLGATYYASLDWILDGGVRLNTSDPGGVHSAYQHVAVTHGRNKDRLITARYAFGREAYQLVGPSAVLSEFNSRSGSLILRKWMSPAWGFNLRGERYLNPSYSRTGVDVSLFFEF